VIGRYSAIYYWEHPYKYVNFVIIGDRVYVIPRDIFYRVYRRTRFFAVSMERFVYLSCFGLPYYDNYYRFSFYNDYYRYNYYRGRRYGVTWYRGLRSHYRKYYRNRWSSRKYRALKKRLIAKRGYRNNKYRSARHRPGHRKVYRNRSNARRGVGVKTNTPKRRYSSRSIGKNSKYRTKRVGRTYRYNTKTRRSVSRKITRRSTRYTGNRTYKRPRGTVRGISAGKVTRSKSRRSYRKDGSRGYSASKRSVRKSSSGRKSSSKRSVRKSGSKKRGSSAGISSRKKRR